MKGAEVRVVFALLRVILATLRGFGAGLRVILLLAVCCACINAATVRATVLLF